MSVTIDLDVDAAGATGSIGAVAASLKGLQHVADDIDIDLDADISDITGEIDAFSDALSNLDADIDNIGGRLENAARELDAAEITVRSDKGGGDGDDSKRGKSPPTIKFDSGFRKAAKKFSPSADGGTRELRQRSRFRGKEVMTISDFETIFKQGRSGVDNLGRHSPNFRDPVSTFDQRISQRDGFGFEPMSMATRRDRSDLEFETDATLGGPLGMFKDDDTEFDLFENFGLDRDKGIFGNVKKATDGLGKKLQKLKPTMGKYMQLLAALIPVAIGLGTQLLGVAAAMGAVATAGAAVIGLGLLGHGETMAGSFEQAKKQLQSLKGELFDVFQPAMQQFAPLQAQMFDAIPQSLEGVSEEMESFTQFDDTLFNVGGAFVGGLEELIAIINRNEGAVSNLTTTFGGLIGSGLLEFFEWLIQAAMRNKQLLIDVGSNMIMLAVAAFNLSMAVTRVVGALDPMFKMLVFISELLNSKLIIGLVTMIAYLFIFGKAAGLVYSLYVAFTTLSGGIANAAVAMFGYEMSTWGAVAATMALVAAIGLLTLGASAVIGGLVTAGAAGGSGIPTGPGATGVGAGSGKQIYNDNRTFNIEQTGGDDYASQKRMQRTVKDVKETNAAQSLPDVGDSTSTSN